MTSLSTHPLRRFSALLHGPLVLLLLLAPCLGANRAAAFLTQTTTALTYWNSTVPGINRFYYDAVGIAATRFGNVYTLWYWPNSDGHHIEQSNLDGTWVKNFGGPDFLRPAGLVVDQTRGDIYVCDAGFRSVVKFDSHGGFVMSFGKMGNADGQFQNPDCIAIDSNRNIYVADTYSHDVQKFSSTGAFKMRWKLERAPGLYLIPQSMAVGPNNELYVLGSKAPEATSKNVLVFSAEGRLLRSWNSQTPDRNSNYFPDAIAVNGIGMVVISDLSSPSLQVFSSTGEYWLSLTVLVKGAPFRFDSLSFYYDDYLYGCYGLAACKFRLF